MLLRLEQFTLIVCGGGNIVRTARDRGIAVISTNRERGWACVDLDYKEVEGPLGWFNSRRFYVLSNRWPLVGILIWSLGPQLAIVNVSGKVSQSNRPLFGHYVRSASLQYKEFPDCVQFYGAITVHRAAVGQKDRIKCTYDVIAEALILNPSYRFNSIRARFSVISKSSMYYKHIPHMLCCGKWASVTKVAVHDSAFYTLNSRFPIDK